MTGTELANAVANVVAGAKGTKPTLAADLRAELETFLAELVFDGHARNDFRKLMRAALTKLGLETVRPLDSIAVGQMQAACRQGLSALSDLDLLRFAVDDCLFELEGILLESYQMGRDEDFGPCWLPVKERVLARLPLPKPKHARHCTVCDQHLQWLAADGEGAGAV